MPEKHGYSVEAIWQGLKLIDGQINLDMILGANRAEKRKFTPYPETKFKFGDAQIGLVEARLRIFVPTYQFVFDRLIPKQTKEDITRLTQRGIDQYFYDVDSNGNIYDPSTSYSHAALLVNLLQKYVCEQSTK